MGRQLNYQWQCEMEIERIIIAAIDRDGGIGKDGYLPWHYPEDLRLFMRLTLGHTVVMGRKTFDGLYDRGLMPLKCRRNIVVTSKAWTCKLMFGNRHHFSLLDFTDRLDCQSLEGKVFYCGGAEIYRQAIEVADTIYLSRFDRAYNCDTFFPRDPDSIGTEFAPYIPGHLQLVTSQEIAGRRPFMLERYDRKRSTAVIE